MRIWDINPGYLNRESLLGEHRELHAIVSIVVHRKRGYARHPETVRWAHYGWALRQRHRLLAAEMALRGYSDRSSVLLRTRTGLWPETYIDAPFEQFQKLKVKYRDKEPGRIPLPGSAQQLWSHHKYSVLARDVNLYRRLGLEVSFLKPKDDYHDLAKRVTELLRTPPSTGGLRNALQHMWGYVSEDYPHLKNDVASWSPRRLLEEIQRRALTRNERYLISSTALSELIAWMPNS